MGIEVVLSIAAGLLGGSWLDKKLDTTPWLTVIGLGYGLAAAARAIYRALKQANREQTELDRQERNERKDYDDKRP